jgi:hypothetical protein
MAQVRGNAYVNTPRLVWSSLSSVIQAPLEDLQDRPLCEHTYEESS